MKIESTRIELAPGVTALVPPYSSIREGAAAEYAVDVWAPESPKGARGIRMLTALLVACLRDVQGLPDGRTWPPLPADLAATKGVELEERFKALMAMDIEGGKMVEVIALIKARGEVTVEEGKKSGAT